MKPFLQDVIQFIPLLQTLVKSAVQDFFTPLKIIPHVGIIAMMDFIYHFINLGVFTVLSTVLSPFLNAFIENSLTNSHTDSNARVEGDEYDKSLKTMNVKELTFEDNNAILRYQLRRLMDQWKFGSGLDYGDHE